MTYITLSDVHKILTSEIERLHGSGTLENILEKIISLPSIDFEEMIKQEIKTRRSYSYTADQGGDRARTRVSIEIDTLHELLNKLPK